MEPSTRLLSAFVFYLSLLSSFLLHQAASQVTTPSGDAAAFARSAAQAVTQPTSAPAPAPSLEDPSAASGVAGPGAAPVAPAGTIKRLTKQHILASIPPNAGANSEPFISSPSGRYTAYLLRRETSPGAGGFGNDFCYIQIRDTGTGQSVWESDCAPASTANTCSLLFTAAGLEVFDGSRSAWDAGVDDEHLETLELVDEGDMRIRTRDGELAWKASDQPRANQECGSPGSPGLASARPPFGAPVEDSRNLPFGQPSQGSGQQQPAGGALFTQPPLGGSAQAVGDGGQQPLVDNTPFDSAGWRVLECWLALGSGLFLALVGDGLLSF